MRSMTSARYDTDDSLMHKIILLLALILVAMAFAACTQNYNDPLATTPPPIVSSTNPTNGSLGVAVIAARFNKAMDASTININTFLVRKYDRSLVAGTVTYDGVSYVTTFMPLNVLLPGTTFSATITTGAKNAAGKALAKDYTWNFSTDSATTNQLPVTLGVLGNYAVLAGTMVSSTGATSIIGGLGVSPGTALIGFPPGTITGPSHRGDSSAAKAQLDLTSAYNDAAHRAIGAVTIEGNIGGLTLPPGLYNSLSSIEISSGDLTLNAGGNPNAIFIFQITSTLTTTSGRKVILSGGAKAANVFWQVGATATLGATSVFKGTLMANQGILANTGATFEGRLLCCVAAVTLDANTIVLPIP